MVVQLHNHSHYSILDGRSRIEEIVSRVKECGQHAVALTDHGVMHGAIEFYRACRAADIKPIVGLEAYMAQASMKRKDSTLDRMGSSSHLTLLAMNETGYRNLLKLTTKAHIEGYYYRPRIDFDCLVGYSEGIFVLSGCMSGSLSEAVLRGDMAEARRLIRVYRDTFGDRYAIEVHNHGHEKQALLNPVLMSLADEFGIRVVAACDSHYARPEDAESHDVMLAIQTGSTRDDPKRFKINPYGAYYLRSEQEMLRDFSGREDAVRNTLWVAEQCNLTLDFSKVMLPQFQIPDGFTPIEWLRKQVYSGLEWRYKSISDAHISRVEYELSIIEKTGYALYFLIVQDYVRYAREKGIMAVPRGSVAGSLCIYALGICDIDPVKYDIIFERFLHEERKGMPDIDMDFADNRRDDVIRYVTEKYGKDRVAHIGTFQTLGARNAIKDVARVLDVNFATSNHFTSLFPDRIDLLLSQIRNEPKIVQAIADNPVLNEVFSLATQLEGLNRGFGTHAAGMLIADTALDDVVPVQLPPGSNTYTGQTLVTQYDNNNSSAVIESLGLSKFDFLGLANLTIIKHACAIIKERHNIDLYGESGEKLYSDLPIDYDHPQAKNAYTLLSQGNTTAVFQCESEGMRGVLRMVRPTKIGDVAAVVALYRPGPMANIPVYAEAKHGNADMSYLHPDLKPFLEETYGVVTYQDQVLLIAKNISGFTWGEVDSLRKGMGKKLQSVVDEQRQKFISKSIAKGYDEEVVVSIWETIAPFAGYGFNKAHAMCYGYVAFITAYLKSNYPIEYMTAVLVHEVGNKPKIAEAVVECRRMGVTVHPPSINVSKGMFSIVSVDGQEGISFGLAALQSVGINACASLVACRDRVGSFTSMGHMLTSLSLSDINQRALSMMISAGAMDEWGNRAQLQKFLEDHLDTFRKNAKSRQGLQSHFLDEFSGLQAEYAMANIPEFSQSQRLEKEMEAVGMYISGHPLDSVRANLEFFCNFTAASLPGGIDEECIVGGMIVKVSQHMTKKGQPMAFVTIQDYTGEINVSIFPSLYEQISSSLTREQFVLFYGKVNEYNTRVSVAADEMLILDPSVNPEVFRKPDEVTSLMWDARPLKPSERIVRIWSLYEQKDFFEEQSTTIVCRTPHGVASMKIDGISEELASGILDILV